MAQIKVWKCWKGGKKGFLVAYLDMRKGRKKIEAILVKEVDALFDQGKQDRDTKEILI